MLAELRVKQLGVIADLGLVLGPGLIALTGETGAGKTLVVEAIELLLGGRADPVLVRPGADEAVIEGRFTLADDDGDDEVVLTRTVPVSGRSRAYVNGRMAPLSALDEAAGSLIDLHGQHGHQSLLLPAAQRAGLDAFARIDLEPVAQARRRLRETVESLARLGGDAASRARELDMLAFQVTEIDLAALTSPEEDDELAVEEDRLAHARSHRDAAEKALAALSGEAGASDALGTVVALLSGHEPLTEIHERLRAAAIELGDTLSDLRSVADRLEDDPDRLAGIRERRQMLRQLRRKYGETLADVMDYGESAHRRQAELESFEQRAIELEREREQAATTLADAETELGRKRRAAAPQLAGAIEAQLQSLAMPKARIEVHVGEGRAGEDVTWLLGANPGEPVRPLAKVASGGELARAMLAVRLVLGPARRAGGNGPSRSTGNDGPSRTPGGHEPDRSTGNDGPSRTPGGHGPDRSTGNDGPSRTPGGDGPPGRDREKGQRDRTWERYPIATLVFDEVDAGIGGEAALAVGRALADLARHHQVLVVTHLPQVAAFADQQIAVHKDEVDGRTVASVQKLDQNQRIVELSRMLSGQPDSPAARRHARELLTLARQPATGR